jgi:hypothetical protein
MRPECNCHDQLPIQEKDGHDSDIYLGTFTRRVTAAKAHDVAALRAAKEASPDQKTPHASVTSFPAASQEAATNFPAASYEAAMGDEAAWHEASVAEFIEVLQRHSDVEALRGSK